MAKWRRAIAESVSDEDLREVVAALVEAAKNGDSWAVKELFDRTLGRPVEADLLARLDALESALAEREAV